MNSANISLQTLAKVSDILSWPIPFTNSRTLCASLVTETPAFANLFADNESNTTIIECQKEVIESQKEFTDTLQKDLAKLNEYKDTLTGVCDYDDLVVYIKNQNEKVEEFQHDMDVFKERLDEKCEKISELEDDLEQKYDLDTAIEIMMDNVPACLENQIIRNAVEDIWIETPLSIPQNKLETLMDIPLDLKTDWISTSTTCKW